jgi:hypothetical protein
VGHDTNYQEGQQIRLTAIKQGAPKKVARAIARYIGTLSLMSATLTNSEIRKKGVRRFGVIIGELRVGTEPRNSGCEGVFRTTVSRAI